MFDHFIVIFQISFINGLIFRFCICLGKEDFYRHKGTIFFQNFSHSVFICKLQTVLIQIQCHSGSDFLFAAFFHLILCSAVAYPVYRLCPFFIGKGIDMYFVSYHECRIESKTEVSDHIILCCLIFIFFKELCCSGKCDLCNVFFYFIGCHSKTIICKFQSLFFWIDFNFDRRFIIIRQLVFTHHIQFLQFCDCITSVGYQLTCENIVIGIYPFFNNWENVFTAD